jgi:hypothetical protein
MTRPRIAQVKKNVDELVSELDDYEAPPRAAERERAPPDAPATRDEETRDVDRAGLAPAWRGATPVLCIAGRGPLDETLATMLAQLLVQRGLGARVVQNAAVARESIASLDAEGAAMACISYVEIRGHPAHLRLLLRRLRARLPVAPLLVGLWPVDDAMLADPAAQREIGATHCVTTLRDAVTACVAAAMATAPAASAEQTAAT